MSLYRIINPSCFALGGVFLWLSLRDVSPWGAAGLAISLIGHSAFSFFLTRHPPVLFTRGPRYAIVGLQSTACCLLLTSTLRGEEWWGLIIMVFTLPWVFIPLLYADRSSSSNKKDLGKPNESSGQSV